MRLCPSCEAENASTNAYCGQCGTILDDARAVVPRYADSKRLVRREVVILFAGVFAVLTALWTAWFFLVSTRSPAHVVRSFIEADRAGQYAQEQELISDAWDARMALSLFQGIRQQAGSSPFQNYRILDTSGSQGDTAFVTVELTLPATAGIQPPPLVQPPAKGAAGKQKLLVTFVLTRRGDTWKIDSSQTLSGVLSALAAQGLQQFQWNVPNLPGMTVPPGWPGSVFPPGTPQAPSGGSSSSPQSGSVL